MEIRIHYCQIFRHSPLLLLILALLLSVVGNCDAGRRHARNVNTTIACEGKMLNITCPEDHVIHIVRANYGRFTITECNDDYKPWTEFCQYPNTSRVMEERCQKKQSCVVPADDRTFRDPCPGTYKYLEATYECRPLTRPVTTTSATSTSVPSSSESMFESMSETTETRAPFAAATVSSSSEVNQPTTIGVGNIGSKIISSTSANRPMFCPEVEQRGLRWPQTRVNNPARLPCPNNKAEAFAEWWCSADGTWIMEYPDLSRCVSPWAHNLDIQAKKMDSEASMNSVANSLEMDTRSNALFGGDVSVSIDVLRHLVISSNHRAYELPAERRMQFLTRLNKRIVDTSSNLLKQENRDAWMDLPPLNQSAAADRLLSSLEKMAISVAKRLDDRSEPLSQLSPQIEMEISAVQIQDYVQFPARSLYDNRLDNAQLPREALEAGGRPDWSKVLFASVEGLAEYMRPEPAIVIDESGHEKLVERRIVSKLMTASVVHAADGVRLSRPALLTFALRNNDENTSNAMCVYWRPMDRRWSDDGCKLRSQNQTHITCQCNHMTTFAVLMDVRGILLSVEHQLALAFITYIGCIVSIVSCALAIIVFCCFGNSHNSDRLTIHKNLCFCLMVAETVFLFGIAQTNYPVACGVVAGLLHYFFLASFSWMLLEGFQLYSMLVEVFESERSRKGYFYLFAYGMPMVIVGISIAIDYSSYGTDRHCWLNTDNYFVFSFVGPVAVVLVANFIFLVMAMVIMCRHTASPEYCHSRGRSATENIRVWLRGATILVVLLGLTWAIGLLYVSRSTVIVAYAFTALNSTQGFFIFVFHVLLNEKTRAEIRKWISRKQKRVPDCFYPPKAAHSYKPPLANVDEPTPMLISGDSSDNQSPPPSLTNFTNTNSNSFMRFLGSKHDQEYKQGSVDQLLLVRDGSSVKPAKYEYPYGCHSSSSDVENISDVTVESPCPRYSTSPRPPPNFPPPSPPKYYRHSATPVGYGRRGTPTLPTPEQHQICAAFRETDSFRRQSRRPRYEQLGGGCCEEEEEFAYASTDAFHAERPDSGYSGSAHQCTPLPAVRRQSNNQPGDCSMVDERTDVSDADLAYEVPVHTTVVSDWSLQSGRQPPQQPFPSFYTCR